MKIIQISPGLVEIPPKGWGAIEEVIWNYKVELENIGNSVEIIRYWDFTQEYKNGWRDFDIVHIHITDQADFFIKNNIPYFFTIHDIHAYMYANFTKEYVMTKSVIINSIVTFCPSMIFMERYSESKNKMVYMTHGFSEQFKPIDKDMDNIKLLCVSNNLSISGVHDNKGYVISDKIAKELGLEITFVGPNDHFFDFEEHIFYGKKVCRNVNKDELVKDFFSTHHILLHMSNIESGQPCLVILESIACGLPVVATRMDYIDIPGIEFVDRDIDSGVKAVKKIINNYDLYRNSALTSSKNFTWANVVRLINIYYQQTIKRTTKLIYIQRENDANGIPTDSIKIIEDGSLLKVECLINVDHNVKFIDSDGYLIYEDDINIYCWAGVPIPDNGVLLIHIKRIDYETPFVFRYQR